MAEIMLHRTQVKQVIPIYTRFLQEFPDINSVHIANESCVFESLKGLGLNWRVGLIKEMAEELCIRYQSVIPQEKPLLMSLPGINEYIASAIRCFAWNYPDPVIDTNTVRILGRLFGMEIKDSSRRNPRFRFLLGKLIEPQNPANFNYALIDLAHLVCHKKIKPECGICPVKDYCNYDKSINIVIEK
jgi:A/G-specific adenine glycosylase